MLALADPILPLSQREAAPAGVVYHPARYIPRP